MQKNFFYTHFPKFEKDISPQSTLSKNSWWEVLLNSIKNKWAHWTNQKTFQLQKNKPESKVVPFSQPNHIVTLNGISVNRLLEPSIDIFLFVKETTTIRVYLRNASKKILHNSSHLVFKGEQDFSIILKNSALSHDTFFVQIREQSGKSQSRRISLGNEVLN